MTPRRSCFVLILAALPLLGAAELGLAPPVVVVYPLTATGQVSTADAGATVGTAIANRLVQLGGITIKPYIAGTTRPQFLTAALSQNADYYITGYLTPLGSEVSVVEQVVSTRSGSIVYSTTAFARTFADAVGPAESLREAILHHAGRGLASLDAPPPPASPAPLADKGGVNISRAFGRHHKATPSPAASASVVAAAGATASPSAGPQLPVAGTPAARVAMSGPPAATLVITTGGTADPAVRTYASQSLVGALERRGVAGAFLPVTTADVGAHAADLCRANAATRFYAPTLAIDGAARGAGAAITLDVIPYDCNAVASTAERGLGSAKAATRAAVERAIDAAAADLAKRLSRESGAATRVTPPAAS